MIGEEMPETCCMGCCWNPRCCRARLGLPLFFHDPVTGAMIGEEMPDIERPQITKDWAGMKKEGCSARRCSSTLPGLKATIRPAAAPMNSSEAACVASRTAADRLRCSIHFRLYVQYWV